MAESYGLDLINMINDAPVTFTFNGTDYTGTFSGTTKRRPLEIGGYADEPTITLTINLKTSDRADVFTTPPVEGDKVTISSTSYRVVSTETDMFSEGLEMQLGSVDK